MAKFFHITSSQGRADTYYLEASNKLKLLSFLNSVSTAVVRNIKEVVYSKTYNINYVEGKENVPSLVYHRVVVVATSKSYSQTFELFNINRSVTKEILMKQLKKLTIHDEPITSFLDITFYDEGVSPISYDNLYQIQYQRNSKTYTENLYSDSYIKVKEFFDTVMDGELLEIRKFVHHDNKVVKDDSTKYSKRVTVYVKNNNGSFVSFIPKVKKTLHDNQLKQMCKESLLSNGKKIVNDEEILLTFR